VTADSLDLGPYRTAPPRLEPAPRHVPLLLRMCLLWGGIVQIVGWGFLAIGLLVSAIFLPQTDLSFATFPSDPSVAGGRVTAIATTNVKENHSPIMAIMYEYTLANGDRWRDTSYVVGNDLALMEGSTVAVEYDPAQPDRSRIRGTRRAPFGPWVLFVLFFPALGLGLILVGVPRGARQIQLLRSGRPARGRLVGARPTKVEINNQPVMELTFEFRTEDGARVRAVDRTHRPHLLEDDEEEELLYDPRRPDRATLLDHLPGSPRVDEKGRLHAPVGPATVLPALLVPLVLLEIAVVAVVMMICI
jgi:hypothetical protein